MKKSWIIFIIIIIGSAGYDFVEFEWVFESLAYFTDLPSFVIVFIPTMFFAIGSYSWNVYKKTWAVTFNTVTGYSKKELKEIHDCALFKGNMALIMGFIGTIMQLILIGQNLDDISMLGPGIAVAAITLFYGLIIKALNMATAHKIAEAARHPG